MRRISIVFAETDDKTRAEGQGFSVFLEGHDMTRLRALPEAEWTAAEFWAMKCFNVLVHNVLKPTGVVVSEETPS